MKYIPCVIIAIAIIFGAVAGAVSLHQSHQIIETDMKVISLNAPENGTFKTNYSITVAYRFSYKGMIRYETSTYTIEKYEYDRIPLNYHATFKGKHTFSAQEAIGDILWPSTTNSSKE